MKISQKLILIIIGVLLFYLHPAQGYLESCQLGTRRVRYVSDLVISLRKALTGIGYEQEVGEIIAKIAEIFPDLERLKELSPENRVSGLARMIKNRIKTYGDGISKLSEVLNNGKANCFGYSQLVYVLGKALELDVEIIPVYPEHVANLIKLDTGYIILDLARIQGYYKSPLFNWDETYRKEASIWRLSERSNLPERYRIIQRINEDGILAIGYCNSGFAKYKLGLYEEAIADYDRTIALDPNFAETFNNRGVAKDDLGRHQEAIADYTRAIELNPDFAEAFNGCGVAKASLGLYEEAIAVYARAIRLNPNLAEVFHNRGSAKCKLGQYEEAIKDYTRAIELKPEYAYAFSDRGVAKYKLGRYEEAIEDFDRAIALAPDLVEAFNGRGAAKDDLGMHEEAITDYDKAIALDPNFAEAFHNRGIAKAILGRDQEAIADYTRAIELNPKYAEALCYRGFAKFRLGQDDRISDIINALQIDPGLYDQLPEEIVNSLNSINWQSLEDFVKEESDLLCAEFVNTEKRSFKDVLCELPNVSPGSYFVLEAKPTKFDILNMVEEYLNCEISILYIPKIDVWIMVKGTQNAISLPNDLQRLCDVGLISSYGHLHSGRFWPDPSESDISDAARNGIFCYVIAETGLGIYAADNLIYPTTGERWLSHDYDLKEFSRVDYGSTEDIRLQAHLEFYGLINAEYEFVPWEEITDDMINPVRATLIENLKSTDELIRVRALRQISILIGKKSLPLLQAFLGDSSAFVRSTAREQIKFCLDN